MKYLSLQETKETSLNCLIHVDKFCRENDIKYSIAFGTLLGAIRHKGFIPWDDDIDIMMSRPEYEKFLDVYQKKNTNANFGLLSFEKGTYYFPFSKIVDLRTKTETNFLPIKNLGIGIDIFPYDFLGKTMDEALNKIKKAHWTARLNQYAVMKKSYRFHGIGALIKTPMFWYAKMRGLKHWRNRIEKLNCNKTYSEPTEYFGFYVDLETLPTKLSYFENLKEYDFEGHKFFGPEEYDKCLTDLYGNYMQLPPESQREPHAQKAWRIDSV